jgi:flagellar motility protein MotE (MotC chaperone)
MIARRKQKRSSTLHIIGGLLITSAIFRMLDGTGQAMAEAEALTSDQMTETAAMPVEEDPDIDTLLGAIKAREMNLDAREAELAARIEALDIVEAEVAEQLIALEDAEQALRETIALADAAAETDLGRLTTVYENMKPKDAAALFEEMAPEFSAGFLGMMNPEPAALIMSLLEPQTAHAISVVLAGRNVGVPTQ